MPVPKEQVILVDGHGRPIDIDALIEELCQDQQRLLVNDEIGLVVYVADLGIYELKPTDSGEFIASPITQISRPRFPVRVLRKQIGARVFSMTADAVFVIRDGDILRKVRAENLKPGMVLASGEKVFR